MGQSRIQELIEECKASDSELTREAGHTLDLVVRLAQGLADESTLTWQAGQRMHSATLSLDAKATTLRAFLLGIESKIVG